MLSILELQVVPAPCSKHSHSELITEQQLDLLGLGRFLKNSQDLETLIVRRSHSSYGTVYEHYHDEVRCWDDLKEINSPLQCLKFVTLHGFINMGVERKDNIEFDGYHIKRGDDVKVIKFLLKRAAALFWEWA